MLGNPAATELSPRPALSVVSPCYNEEASLGDLYHRVTEVCRDVVGDGYEIVLVNDGSRDGTWLRMMLLAEHDPHVTAVNLSRNHGHQLALSAGLSLCRGERVFILDADLHLESKGRPLFVIDRVVRTPDPDLVVAHNRSRREAAAEQVARAL